MLSLLALPRNRAACATLMRRDRGGTRDILCMHLAIAACATLMRRDRSGTRDILCTHLHPRPVTELAPAAVAQALPAKGDKGSGTGSWEPASLCTRLPPAAALLAALALRQPLTRRTRSSATPINVAPRLDRALRHVRLPYCSRLLRKTLVPSKRHRSGSNLHAPATLVSHRCPCMPQ